MIRPTFLRTLTASIAALIGLGGHSPIVAPPPVVTNPSPAKRRRRNGGSFLGIRSGHAPASTAKDEQRLALRAERDLRACRLNYPGWCGFEESGTTV